jgi:hypothetical protein
VGSGGSSATAKSATGADGTGGWPSRCGPLYAVMSQPTRGRPLVRRKQQLSPRCKSQAGIAKPHYDPLAAQNARRAAELHTQNAAHRKANKIDLEDTSKIPRMPPEPSDEEIDSM